ncbi:non-ribosomal peptide synthetase [Stutzerimonas zhaodongensis]|jgi:amino acid adenylation domain-containing protein|uniref:non-ribosomal peptide synthetase n=1 Tax=Stutzerimonas zhaodongensis TaxID=1176257 RepID=UPI001F4DE7AB|nr:non-ribosomal peptide synthetase [Stutzerimonas zhaodongensis]UNG16762.1 amino acid adenylation domain-containing protein [Stutzerimonas zhaodongensis]
MQNNIVGLLKHLAQQGVQLALNDEQQLVSKSSKEAVTPALGQQIRDNRDAIIECLRAQRAFDAPIAPQHLSVGPLSSSQSGLWFIEQYEQDSHLYNMPVFFRLTGELDVAALEFAFDALVARHASLRTRFQRSAEGRGEQEILPHTGFRLARQQLGHLEPHARENLVAQRVREEIQRPFDITSGQLTRVTLLELGKREHLLLINQHHIISDGWSVKNMFADLKTAFLAYQNRERLTWDEPALTYIDYAQWFNSPLFRDYHEQFKPFWVERLTGIPEVHSLPLDKPRPAQPASGGEVIFSTIDNALWERFKGLCQQHNTSPFIGLHAVFALLLARHSGERDIVVGTPLAYRERADIEPLVGFFVNTLVLRTRLPEQQRFVDYLRQCRADDLEAFDHQLYRFEALSEALGMDRHTAINPIFQIMLVYQARVDFNDLIPGCDAVEETSPVLPAKTDISVKVTELMGAVRVDWLYATALFERSSIEGYANRLQNLMQAIVDAPERDIWQLPMHDPQQLNEAAQRLARLPKAYPEGLTALSLFSDMARLHPNRPALRQGDGCISYAELDARANRLARWLQAQGCKPGARIGLLARRENTFAVALLASWKIGAAYVPLDPNYPQQRLTHIMRDADLRLMIGQGAAPFDLEPAQRWVDVTSHEIQLQLDAQSPSAPALTHDPQRLAQVIYTSGSTGLPKGVMVEQGSLANLLLDHGRRLDVAPGDRMLDCMSLSFDAGNMCALVPLAHGACLLWADPGEGLLDEIERTETTHMIFATALLATLPERPLPAMKAVGFGGEACPPAIPKRWASQFRLIDMYGPTEATVTALTKTLTAGSRLTIGKPIDGMQAVILDRHGALCPVGVPGELCLAGLGLARGYLNQPERTAEAFREHDVAGVKVRVYHTGDRARLLASGEYEYLGRLDAQIKLRGYRIEPGEIEAQLHASWRGLQEIKVMVVSQDTRQALVAYATVTPGEPIPEPEAVLQAAAHRLPEYMVPQRLIILDKMPLTANGKLDQRQLPKVELADAEQRVPPNGDLERHVLEIWQGVLNQPLGVESDFFRLGGDSILSIQLATRLHDAGYPCSVKEVFEAKTVRRLCRLLDGPRETPMIRAEQGLLTGDFPLQPIQQWFFEQPFSQPQHWNQGVVLHLPAEVSQPQLMDYMRQLLAQHDALRLIATPSGQCFRDFLPLPEPARLDAAELGGAGLQHALTELQSHLDPASARTLAWAIIKNVPNGHRGLFIAFHHLVIDAVSWRILVEDLQRLARGDALPEKTSSYRQWGEGLAAYAKRAEGQLPYWREQVGTMHHTAREDWSSAERSEPQLLQLDEAITRQLTQMTTKRLQVDVRELLLAALTRSLVELGLGEEQWIMLEGHGRESIDAGLDVSRTVGWFTSMFPVKVHNQADWPALVQHAAKQLRQVPDKGVGYLPLRSNPAHRDNLPLPTVALNYLGSYQSGAGDWQALPIPPGNPSGAGNQSAELISLHGGVFDGLLTLRQIGSLRSDLTARLLQSLGANLQALAALAGEQQ